MTLLDQTATFLEAEGWEVTLGASGKSSVLGSREELGGQRYVTVWCPTADEMQLLRQWEPAMLRRIAEAAGRPGEKILLLDSQAGLSRSFREQFGATDVTMKAPIQFFDRTFSWDEVAHSGKRGASAARRLRDAGVEQARERVPQPYQDDNGNQGDDLFDELARRFESSAEWDKPIILVTAPAGYGKTMLFQSLFARLHEHFHSAKNRREQARRPLPLLPEHLGESNSSTLPSLVDQFLRTDVASPMSRAAFEWMLTNGYGSWLIDGLDEVIARDPNFFEYIESIILDAGKIVTPRILLCVRDSLLSTSDSLRTLVNEVDGLVTRYQLQPWKRNSIATYARMRLMKEHDWRMLAWVDHRPQVMSLCGTPYYATLVADRVDGDRGAGLVDIPESELIRDAIRAILEREYAKDLRPQQFSLDDLLYVLRDAAVLQLESAPRGIDIEPFGEEVSILVSELSAEEQERVLAQVLKLSVFSGAGERGRIRFTHDAVHEYLIADQAVSYFGDQPAQLLDLLNCGEFPMDSIALRIIAEHIDRHGGSDDLLPLLLRAKSAQQASALRNLVSVLMRLRDANTLLAEAPLAGQDLSGLTFTDLTFAGVSLAGANLESVTFDRCDLTGLDLTDATLAETRFNRCRPTLHAASYGTLRGLISVTIDGQQRIETASEFVAFLRRSGKRAGATVDPCQHALQLRALFKAMIGPDGRPRRKRRTSLVKGAASSATATVLDSAIRAGFVTPVQGRTTYECVRGSQYQTMVAFARNLETTPGITALLDGLCSIKGCTHIGL